MIQLPRLPQLPRLRVPLTSHRTFAPAKVWMWFRVSRPVKAVTMAHKAMFHAVTFRDGALDHLLGLRTLEAPTGRMWF